MYCRECGNFIPDGLSACPKCGAPAQPQAPGTPGVGSAPAAPAPVAPGTPGVGSAPVAPGASGVGSAPQGPQPPFQPYNPQPQTGYPACPENHLVKAILVTVLCCWPLGIPAIVYASLVETAYHTGQFDLAVQRSRIADRWANAAIISGVIFVALYIILIASLAALGVLSDM
ncbi:MAG: CD225/dispanin family protein [Bacteroidales bacterium]|nr:CD225/dispanin family protein [Bacteroidales bacterium]